MLRVEAEQHWMCLETGLWEGGANEDLIRGSMRKPNGEVGTRYCVHVNMCLTTSYQEYEYQDRRQEIVFIGHRMKEAAIQELLDQCLLTEEEMALGPDKWKETMEDEESIVLELDDGASFNGDDGEEGDLDEEVIEEEEDIEEEEGQDEDVKMEMNGNMDKKRKFNMNVNEIKKKKPKA